MKEVKQLYWTLREQLPVLIRSLKSDPIGRRVLRKIQSTLHRTIHIGGVKIELSNELGDEVVAYLLSGKYEEPERRILDKALAPGDRVLELGTGIGYLSTYCARRIGSENVFTFEVNHLLRKTIEKTYKLNAVSPNIRFVMLGEKEGNVEFFVTRNVWASSTIRSERAIKTITTNIAPFNEVVAVIKPNFLIVDIEGGEVELFRHADLEPFNKICIEFHPYVVGKSGVSDVINALVSAGFAEDCNASDEEHKLFVRH